MKPRIKFIGTVMFVVMKESCPAGKVSFGIFQFVLLQFIRGNKGYGCQDSARSLFSFKMRK